MGNILSRTARIYNNSSVDMKLEVKLEPGCPQPPIFIQAGQYQDLPYRQFCLEDINPNVKVTLLISPAVGKFRERDKQLIMPAEIRDFSEIHIDYKRRKVLISKVEGPLRRRTRFFLQSLFNEPDIHFMNNIVITQYCYIVDCFVSSIRNECHAFIATKYEIRWLAWGDEGENSTGFLIGFQE